LALGVDSKLLVINKSSNDNTVISVADLYSKTDKLKLFLRKFCKTIKATFHLTRDPRYNPPSFLLSILKRVDFDIIHLHWVTESFINFKELSGIKKPIIWTMHDCAAFTGICNVKGTCDNFINGCGKCPLLNSDKKRDISSREFNRKKEIYSSLDMTMVSPSHWISENASLSPLLNGKTIKVIPHGLNTDLFKPVDKLAARKVMNFGPDTKLIICGSVTLSDKNKGIQLFREAISTIESSRNERSDFEVVVFGESPDVNISFGFKTSRLGYVNDEIFLRIVYSIADVVVVPSIQESFGLTALEALACGIPVVAFAATGLLDIVDHKENGYLATPYDSDDLAKGIVWCLDNNSDNKLSENAVQKVQKHFDIKLIAQKYKELYSRTISNI